MLIIDSHVHFWRLDDGDRLWICGKIAALDRDFTDVDLAPRCAEAGVRGVVLLQAGHGFGEAERWLERAAAIPLVHGFVGRLDPRSDAIAEELARLRRHPLLAGVRPLPPDTFGAAWLTDARTRRGVQALQRAAVPTDLLVPFTALDDARQLLETVPDLPVVLNHGGRPPVMSGVTEPWGSRVRAFARETRAMCKVSAIIERGGIDWTKESLKPWIALLLDAFGPTRLMFGSNWPLITLGATYRAWVALLPDLLADLGLRDADIAAVMGANAARFYRLRTA
jgi:L-fucono-1,5-lactonase